jgi:hypothetical protein
MATAEKPAAIPAADLADLQRAVDDMIQGVRDLDAMDRAAREIDEGREEIRWRLGELNIAVELTDPDEDEDE